MPPHAPCTECSEPLPFGVRYCPFCSEAVKGGRQSRCRECSGLLDPAFRHCPGCGEPTGAGGPIQASDDLTERCPACGSPRAHLHLHCPSCGKLREDPFEECPGCERPVDPRWLYCGACGDRIEHLFHLQERGFSCGAAAVRNAFTVLGIRQDEPYLREVMGSRPFHGTSDEGFARGARAFGLEHEHVLAGDLDRLRAEVNAGHPVVVDWRHGAHYVCVVAITERHVVFVDSNPRDADIVRLLTHQRFMQLWWDDEDPAIRKHAMHVFRRPPEVEGPVKIASWNVNGLRACDRHGFSRWMRANDLDAVCLQEVKARPEDVAPRLRAPKGYSAHWHPAEKPGYSGVVVYSRREPLSVTVGLGARDIDREGRVLQVEYPGFVLVNAYFPNSGRDLSRLPYKLEFCKVMQRRLDAWVKKGKHIVLCGDFNIAHREIDLRNPKSNQKNAGFLPEERAWMTAFLARGYADAFRHFNSEPDHYTWWSYRAGVRAKNVGWRLDCFVTNRDHLDRLKATTHQTQVRGSDHCPVVLELKD